MSTAEIDPVIARVRRALGRSAASRALPVPPEIQEPIIRLVHAEIGLAELFVRSAKRAGIVADLVHPDEVALRLMADLRNAGIDRVAVGDESLLQNLGIPGALEIHSLERLRDAGCQILTPSAAVAETGTLVFRPVPGRCDPSAADHLFVIVEPRKLLPDLVDLFTQLSNDPDPRPTLLLTGGEPKVWAYVLH